MVFGELMSNDKQEIAEKIRNGSYFKDANEWYAGKYLYPVTERSLMFLFAVAAIFALLPIALLLYSSVGSSGKLAFPIYVDDSSEHFSIIKPLADDKISPQEAIAKYLITDYVQSREEYIRKNINSEKLKKLFKKIKFSSAKQVANEYVSYMSENNPYSPIARYKDHTDRTIEIKSLSFLDNDQTSGKAKVLFEATETTNAINSGKPVIVTSLWEVIVTFRLPDIATIARNGAPLRLVVGYYRANLVDKSSKQDVKAK